MDNWSEFVNIVDGFKLFTLVGLILADFLLGVAVAIKKGNFRFQNLADFVSKTTAPLFIGYYALGIAATAESSLKPVVYTVFAFIVASLVAMVLGHVKELGFPTPDILSSGKTVKTEKPVNRVGREVY